MPVYTYETIPQTEGELPEVFEIKQSMKDAPLERHPDSGKPVRRVITGGYGLMTKSKGGAPAPEPAGPSCCGASCGCH